MNTDTYYMTLAIKEARKALLNGDVPVGCVLVKNHEVIATGYNQREYSKDPTAHAEIIALRKAGEKLHSWHLDDVKLYVTLEPCPMCAGALINARIKTIIYGVDEPLYGACGSQLNLVQFPSFPHNIRVRSGILKEECYALLQEFFKILRKEANHEPEIK